MSYLLDLDGTILDGSKENRDSVKFITQLQKDNINFLIMTNSVKSPTVVVERLSSVGIHIDKDRVLNPIHAINRYLKVNRFSNAHIVGSKNEVEQLEIEQNTINPEIVILLDFEKENYGYNELQSIFSLMQKNTPVIAASGSVYYLKNGIQYLDTGSFVKLLESASNTTIKIFGKPSIEYFIAGISLLETDSKNVTVIGDDWSTDICGGKSIGCECILLKSGKYSNGDEDKIKNVRAINYLLEIFEE